MAHSKKYGVTSTGKDYGQAVINVQEIKGNFNFYGSVSMLVALSIFAIYLCKNGRK